MPVMEFYDISEIMEKLKLSRACVEGLLLSGKLKGRKNGKKWIVSEQHLNDYINGVDNDPLFLES